MRARTRTLITIETSKVTLIKWIRPSGATSSGNVEEESRPRKQEVFVQDDVPGDRDGKIEGPIEARN